MPASVFRLYIQVKADVVVALSTESSLKKSVGFSQRVVEAGFNPIYY